MQPWTQLSQILSTRGTWISPTKTRARTKDRAKVRDRVTCYAQLMKTWKELERRRGSPATTLHWFNTTATMIILAPLKTLFKMRSSPTAHHICPKQLMTNQRAATLEQSLPSPSDATTQSACSSKMANRRLSNNSQLLNSRSKFRSKSLSSSPSMTSL